jgi:hypothetical protein
VDAVERAVLAERQVRRADACVDVVASANVAELCVLALDELQASAGTRSELVPLLHPWKAVAGR